MFGYNHLKLFLLICFSIKSVCSSKDSSDVLDQYTLSSDYVYKNPLRIYRYPPPNLLQPYIFYPETGHYELLNYQKPIPMEKLEVPKPVSLFLNNKLSKISDSAANRLYDQNKNYGTTNTYPLKPAPFKKPEPQKSSPLVVYNKYSKFNDGTVSKVSEGGKKYEDGYHKKHGYRTNEGYSTDQKYSKENKESYDKNHDANDEKAEKESNSEKHEDYKNSEHENKHEENEKGEKYNSKKQHQKGSKSKGYHNVFMKDEYRKDHIFYDDSDESGHYSKHGSEHENYHNDEHKQSKGSHNNSGGESNGNKKQSLTEKKEYDTADKGYKKESNHKSHDDQDKDFYIEEGKSSYNVAIKHSK